MINHIAQKSSDFTYITLYDLSYIINHVIFIGLYIFQTEINITILNKEKHKSIRQQKNKTFTILKQVIVSLRSSAAQIDIWSLRRDLLI